MHGFFRGCLPCLFAAGGGGGQDMKEVVTSAHGTGGKSSFDLVQKIFKRHLAGPLLSPDDAASFPTPLSVGGEAATGVESLLVTTDTHVVDPIIFPGGDIGKLAITGVVNDLLTRGGRPQFLSLGFVLEEGLPLSSLSQIVASLAKEMNRHEIQLLCADTKVVTAREGKAGLMIASTLFGEPINPNNPNSQVGGCSTSAVAMSGPQVGDHLILTGPLGSHGLAVLQARETLPFQSTISSDCASLFPLLAPLLYENAKINYMRDPTRGGLAGILHELALQFKISFELDESSLPAQPAVRAGLELLGLDLLEVANEGVMLLFVPEAESAAVVERLRMHPLGQAAVVVGKVRPSRPASAVQAPLVMVTALGGRRVVPWPEALNLPRIC
ncbi:MAG: hydrogenase expression/formation protein HypE [Bdellovibrio sp.]|nr:MAG: hydrogenase expression/formation protein HypE [Bdellovibrio sp.]